MGNSSSAFSVRHALFIFNQTLHHRTIVRRLYQMLKKQKKLHPYYTREITPKRVTSGETHRHGLAPGLQLRKNVAAVATLYPIRPASEWNPRPPEPIDMCFTNELTGKIHKLSITGYSSITYATELLQHGFAFLH